MIHERVAIFGPSSCGKTNFLFKYLIKHEKYDNIYLICPTWEEQKLYKNLKIHCKETNPDKFEKIYDEAIQKGKENKDSLIILDDCLGHQILNGNGAVGQKIISCRHKRISIIILSQNYKSIPPIIRNNLNKIVCFYSNNQGEGKKMKEELGDNFYDYYNEFTSKEPYTFILMDLTKNELSGERYLNSI